MCAPGGSDYQKQGVVMKHVRGTYASVTITASIFTANQLSFQLQYSLLISCLYVWSVPFIADLNTAALA